VAASPHDRPRSDVTLRGVVIGVVLSAVLWAFIVIIAWQLMGV